MLSNDMLSIYPVRYLYGSYNKGAWTQNKAYKTAIPYRTRIHYDKISSLSRNFVNFYYHVAQNFRRNFFFTKSKFCQFFPTNICPISYKF